MYMIYTVVSPFRYREKEQNADKFKASSLVSKSVQLGKQMWMDKKQEAQIADNWQD